MFRKLPFCSPRKFAARSLRNVALLCAGATIFWLFQSAPKVGQLRNIFPVPESNSSAPRSAETKTTNHSGQSTSPVPASNTTHPSPTVISLMTSALSLLNGDFLSQRAPMVGTGQGNLMFMYASLLGIADTNKMIPAYPKDGALRNIFHISASLPLVPANCISVTETKASAYDAQFASVSKRRQNITAVGYLQSWKYFDKIRALIRQEFTFVDSIRANADSFLANISTANASTSQTVLYIGVHIRRTDMLVSYNVVRGYTVATKEYLASAVQYFRSQHQSDFLIFVVCGDDVNWARKNFPPADNSSDVVFSVGQNAAQDMALLSACNHSIFTVGTYGWWSSYLAGGKTVYYKNFPNPGSHISNVFNKNDYFLPDWIGM